MNKYLSVLVLLQFVIAINACESTSKPVDNQDNQPTPSQPREWKVDTLLTDLQNPWGIAQLPNGDLLLTERDGYMVLYSNGTATQLQWENSTKPDIEVTGQGGLLDVVLHPRYSENSWIYFTASTQQGNGYSTALFRTRLNGTTLQNTEKLFQSLPISTSSLHFGSRIVFDDKGYVFVCFGERNSRNLAQDNSNHAGTVVRLHDDGRVPQDNPFVGKANSRPEIWSFGHRNPQGMAMNPATKELWLHEHGPRGGDELNKIVMGGNYGWPLVTYGIGYDGRPISNDTAMEGLVQPVHYWVPSIAPCGMTFYNGDSIPQWKGNIFIGALAGRHIARLEMQGEKVVSEEKMFLGMARFRAVIQGRDQYLYIATESPGMLMRITPKP